VPAQSMPSDGVRTRGRIPWSTLVRSSTKATRSSSTSVIPLCTPRAPGHQPQRAVELGHQAPRPGHVDLLLPAGDPGLLLPLRRGVVSRVAGDCCDRRATHRGDRRQVRNRPRPALHPRRPGIGLLRTPARAAADCPRPSVWSTLGRRVLHIKPRSESMVPSAQVLPLAGVRGQLEEPVARVPSALTTSKVRSGSVAQLDVGDQAAPGE
jgi:hypothetical protein